MLTKHWSIDDNKTLTETISSLIFNQHQIITIVPLTYKEIGSKQLLINALIIYN